jgi:hypothetical protein
MSPMSAELQPERPVSLRPIEDFLQAPVPAPAVAPPVRSTDPYVAEFEAQPEELPPVEHFMDPLPEGDIFADTNAASSDSAPIARSEIPPEGVNAADALETGWLETDWQHYDWHAAAALGEGVDDATRAWATTDWDGAGARQRDPAPPTASSIATALDEIARRLREGELAAPGSSDDRCNARSAFGGQTLAREWRASISRFVDACKVLDFGGTSLNSLAILAWQDGSGTSRMEMSSWQQQGSGMLWKNSRQR